MTPCRNCKGSGMVSNRPCIICNGLGNLKPVTLNISSPRGAFSFPLTASSFTPYSTTPFPTLKFPGIGVTPPRLRVDLTQSWQRLLSPYIDGDFIIWEQDEPVDLLNLSSFAVDPTKDIPTQLTDQLTYYFADQSILDYLTTRRRDSDGFVSDIYWVLKPTPSFTDLLDQLYLLLAPRSLSYRLARYEGNYATGEMGWSVLLTTLDGKHVLSELACELDPLLALAAAHRAWISSYE